MYIKKKSVRLLLPFFITNISFPNHDRYFSIINLSLKKRETFLSNTSGKFIYHNHPTHTEQSSQTNKFKRIEERKYSSAKYLSLWVTTMDISSHWYQSTWTLTASDWHSPNVGPDVHSMWTDYSCMTYRATEIKSKWAAVSRLGQKRKETRNKSKFGGITHRWRNKNK